MLEEAGEGEEVSRPGDAMGKAGIAADAIMAGAETVHSDGLLLCASPSQRRQRDLARMMKRVKMAQLAQVAHITLDVPYASPPAELLSGMFRRTM